MNRAQLAALPSDYAGVARSEVARLALASVAWRAGVPAAPRRRVTFAPRERALGPVARKVLAAIARTAGDGLTSPQVATALRGVSTTYACSVLKNLQAGGYAERVDATASYRIRWRATDKGRAKLQAARAC